MNRSMHVLASVMLLIATVPGFVLADVKLILKGERLSDRDFDVFISLPLECSRGSTINAQDLVLSCSRVEYLDSESLIYHPYSHECSTLASYLSTTDDDIVNTFNYQTHTSRPLEALVDEIFLPSDIGMAVFDTDTGCVHPLPAGVKVVSQPPPPPPDRDNDGVPDASDNCINTPNAGQQDSDNDGVGNACDNCIERANPDQRDSNLDGYGNMCDPDFDGNLIVNAADLAYMKTTFFSSDPHADLNGDGVVNAGDLAILKMFFFRPPGPSGVAP